MTAPALPYKITAGRLELQVAAADEAAFPGAVLVTVLFAEAPDEPLLLGIMRRRTTAEARRLSRHVQPVWVRDDVFKLLRGVAQRHRPPAGGAP